MIPQEAESHSHATELVGQHALAEKYDGASPRELYDGVQKAESILQLSVLQSTMPMHCALISSCDLGFVAGWQRWGVARLIVHFATLLLSLFDQFDLMREGSLLKECFLVQATGGMGLWGQG